MYKLIQNTEEIHKILNKFEESTCALSEPSLQTGDKNSTHTLVITSEI